MVVPIGIGMSLGLGGGASLAGAGALGAGIGSLGGPVGAGMGGGVLASLMAHPLWGNVISQIGGTALQGILGTELPYGQYAQEQLQAISGMLPELQQAAAGQPTAASKAIKEQVKTEGRGFQQSYAQGARKAGMVGGLPGGTTPYRAQQGRVQAATEGAMIQRLGQYQQGAQQTLAGMAPTAFQHAGIQEMTDMKSREAMMGFMGDFNKTYFDNQYDPQYRKMIDFLEKYYFQTAGTSLRPVNPTGR